MLVVSLVTIFVAVLIWLYLAHLDDRTEENRVFAAFAVDSGEYELLAHDLGSDAKKLFLEADGAIGVADAVFRHRRLRHVLVGEFKSRRFNGRVTDYERYQMTLYLGVAEARFRKPATGKIRYGCGTLVDVELDPDTYRWLIALVPAVRAAALSPA